MNEWKKGRKEERKKQRNKKEKEEQNQNFHMQFSGLWKGLMEFGGIIEWLRAHSSLSILFYLAVFIFELLSYLEYRTPFWTYPITTEKVLSCFLIGSINLLLDKLSVCINVSAFTLQWVCSQENNKKGSYGFKNFCKH